MIEFKTILTSALTYLLTAVALPAIVAAVPRFRRWLFQPVPSAIATLGALAGLSATALALAFFLFFESVTATSRTFPDESRFYEAKDNNTPLGREADFESCAISYYQTTAGQGGQCGVIKEGQFWKVRISGGQYCRVICFKLVSGR